MAALCACIQPPIGYHDEGALRLQAPSLCVCDPQSSILREGGETQPMTVIIRPGESQESLLKRFRKEVADSRILSTYRKKRWFVSKSEEKRKSKQRATRKARRKEQQAAQR